MKATKEFIDFYNVSFGKKENLKGELSLKEIEDDIQLVSSKIESFNGDVKQLREYIQQADVTSDTLVMLILYTVLTGNHGFTDVSEPNLKKVLLKYTDHLKAIKEVNKPTYK
jgi:hypothetical protein